MKLSRRILVVHAEERARRRLVLVLVEAGYDVRAFAGPEPALAAAHGEWFDVALVDYALPAGKGFGFAGRLRERQPTLPIIMLLPALELPLIVQGIRLGLTDVLAAEEDPRPVLRRVNALLRPDEPERELTESDLAAAEEVLSEAAAADSAGEDSGASEAARTRSEDLTQVVRERTDLEERLERTLREKEALQAELSTLLAQNTDGAHLQTELAELRSQRETAAAIEAKAVQLAETRAQIAAERSALEEEKRAIANSRAPFTDAALEAERLELKALRQDVRAEERRVREQAAQLRQESTTIAQERRRWHEELDQLREREENLRRYEQRLREMQAQLESERLTSANASAAEHTNGQNDPQLLTAWEKLHRASELLEAERATFRDERMAMKDLEQTIRRREERLRQLEEQIARYEGVRRELPPVPPEAPAATRCGRMLHALTRPRHLWG